AVQRCSRPAGEPTLYFRPERLPLARAPGIHIRLTWRWLGCGRRSGLGRVRPRLRGLSGLDPVAPFPALRPTFRARATTAAAAAATTPAPPPAPRRPGRRPPRAPRPPAPARAPEWVPSSRRGPCPRPRRPPRRRGRLAPRRGPPRPPRPPRQPEGCHRRTAPVAPGRGGA